MKLCLLEVFLVSYNLACEGVNSVVSSEVLLRLCLFVPTLVGAVGLLDTSAANAIQSPAVNVESQTAINHLEPNLLEDLENPAIIDTDTANIKAVDTLLLQPTNLQADELEHQLSDYSKTLAQSITEAAPQDNTIDSSNHSDELSQVTLDNQAAKEQPASLNEVAPNTNNIDSRELLDSSTLDQITSVSQLSDVQPTDWAYQALQSLVERYGCIVGYPDGAFKGQRALTRFEFAAGLNACLNRVSEIIASSTANLATKEDLATLQRLQEEFAAELASLRGRVDGLEARTAELEASQFSTTTKLSGTTIFTVADVFGGSGGRNVTVGQYRTNLDLTTSFTGRDLLTASLWAGNIPAIDPGVGFNLPGETVGRIEIPSAEGTLSSQFGANTNNNLGLVAVAYTFPVGEQLLVTVAPGGFLPLYSVAPTLNPYLDDSDGGTGAISVFGERNAIYSLGAGGGLSLNYFLGRQLRFSAGYLADGLGIGNPNPGSGLFNGGYSAIGQITWTPAPSFSIAATYINGYFPGGRFGFNYNSFGVAGTSVANTLAGQTRLSAQRLFQFEPVISNSYGVQATFQPSPGFAISGWFGATYARLIQQGDGQILNYALTFAFLDLGKQGNLLGLVVGAEPYLTRFRGGDPEDFETDIPFHIEAFYRYQLTDNISITPGVIWLTAPNQDNNNPDDVIATLRTTFKF
jgi:hypothetical protein